jgi:hypothetical protein
MIEGIEWVKENVADDERILVVYGDGYNQHALFSLFAHRMHYTDWNYIPNNIGFDLSESIEKITSGRVYRYYNIREFIHGRNHPVRTGTFQVEDLFIWDHLNWSEEKKANRGFEPMDICSFDYVVIDKMSASQELMAYNRLIYEELSDNDQIEVAFSNPWYWILHNKDTGEDCIEEEETEA